MSHNTFSLSLILGPFERDPCPPHKRGSIYKQGFVLSHVEVTQNNHKNVRQPFEVEPKLTHDGQKASKSGGVDSNTLKMLKLALGRSEGISISNIRQQVCIVYCFDLRWLIQVSTYTSHNKTFVLDNVQGI